MARAPLPKTIPVDTFFVLVWDSEVEDMVIYLDNAERQSFSMGSDLPQNVRQLTWWGLTVEFATRAVDSAREFRKVQVIPKQGRVINLFDRRGPGTNVGASLQQIESDRMLGYAHL